MSNPYGDAKRPRSGASRPKLNGAVWQRTRTAVRRRDGNRCVDCGSSDRLSVHHIVPARLGGADSMANHHAVCPLPPTNRGAPATHRGEFRSQPLQSRWVRLVTRRRHRSNAGPVLSSLVTHPHSLF
jgi:5-methylcytosine-specific restriction endonuclease McrA